MNLVHKIARNLLLANTKPPTPPNLEYDPGHYRTFNPTLIEDITTYQFTVGNIFSTSTSWSTLLSTWTTRSIQTIWQYLKVSSYTTVPPGSPHSLPDMPTHPATSGCGRTGYTGPTGRTGPRHDPPDPSAYSTHTALPRLAS